MMCDEITIFILGYLIGAFLTFIILFAYYYVTLKHLVTVNINNYPSSIQAKEGWE